MSWPTTAGPNTASDCCLARSYRCTTPRLTSASSTRSPQRAMVPTKPKPSPVSISQEVQETGCVSDGASPADGRRTPTVVPIASTAAVIALTTTCSSRAVAATALHKDTGSHALHVDLTLYRWTAPIRTISPRIRPPALPEAVPLSHSVRVVLTGQVVSLQRFTGFLVLPAMDWRRRLNTGIPSLGRRRQSTGLMSTAVATRPSLGRGCSGSLWCRRPQPPATATLPVPACR